MKLYTQQQVVETLRSAIKEAGGRAAFCQIAGVGEPFLSDVMTGKKQPSPRLLDTINIELVRRYAKKQEGNKNV